MYAKETSSKPGSFLKRGWLLPWPGEEQPPYKMYWLGTGRSRGTLGDHRDMQRKNVKETTDRLMPADSIDLVEKAKVACRVLKYTMSPV